MDCVETLDVFQTARVIPSAAKDPCQTVRVIPSAAKDPCQTVRVIPSAAKDPCQTVRVIPSAAKDPQLRAASQELRILRLRSRARSAQDDNQLLERVNRHRTQQ